MRQLLPSLRLAIVLLFLASPVAAASAVPKADTFVFEGYGAARTLDPAVAYDHVSHQRIMNIYEGLVFFDGSATDRFVPVLAAEVPARENGGVSDDGKTYIFRIRQGVTFQHGGELTAGDVAYSLKRHMVVDPEGGPMWMLLKAVTGETSTRGPDGAILPGVFEAIDRAVTAEGDTVTIRLAEAFPPLLAVLAYGYGGAVLDKEWAVAQGCWDGDPATAARYNNPAPGAEPLRTKASGTGAFGLASWEVSGDAGEVFTFQRFEGYWGPKPALERAVYRQEKAWSERRMALETGEADRVQVDAQHLGDVIKTPGVKLSNVPQLAFAAALFCQDLKAEGNPHLGSGKLDGRGIPPDFFADIHVRRAFAHAFDRQTYAAEAWGGRVIMPTSPNVAGLPFHKKTEVYVYDLDAAGREMRKAWGGRVWEKGFYLAIVHNAGNAQREAAARMLAGTIMSLNPKFRIEVKAVAYADYLVRYAERLYPVFLIGWGADYPDPDNFLHPFMHSRGVYGRAMAYANPEADRLIEAGQTEPDWAAREKLYHRLQDIWREDAVGVPLYQDIETFAYRDRVHGFVPHPMFDAAWENLKALEKR